MHHKSRRQATLATIGSQVPSNRCSGAVQDDLLARNWGQRATLDVLLLRTGRMGLRFDNRMGQDSLGRASRGISKSATIHRCQTTPGDGSALLRDWAIAGGPGIKTTIVAWVLHQRAAVCGQHNFLGIQLSRDLHTMVKSMWRESKLNPLRREMRS